MNQRVAAAVAAAQQVGRCACLGHEAWACMGCHVHGHACLCVSMCLAPTAQRCAACLLSRIVAESVSGVLKEHLGCTLMLLSSSSAMGMISIINRPICESQKQSVSQFVLQSL